MFKSFIEEYKGKNIGLLLENEPLSKHTTFRVGGPARCLVIPNSKQSLVETMKLINKYELPFKVIGRGSNLLPSDHVEIDGTQVTVGAGVSTILLANKVAKCELAGLEFISGVPGSVGGAIYMNAGAYNREIQDVLVKALILDEAGELKWLTVEEMGFSYRQSILQTHRNWIVVEAVLQLEKGSYEEIMELMKARKVRRIESQPTNLPSAGSTFRNPLPHYSWQLIEKSGLRGVRIGGAEVSQKHCNFIVNVGGATATDIYELIQHVQAVVFEKHGIQLHPEVEMFNW